MNRGRRPSVAIILVAVVVLTSSVAAEVGQVQRDQVQRDQRTPQRDKAEAPTGTATIAGVVVTQSEPQQPVRRVSVILASGPIEMPRTAVTDDEGRFEFKNLPSGNYTLAAQKPAWVPAVYGARGPTDTQGIPVAVVDGQRVAGLRLPIMRGAVVSGVVRLAGGQPAQNLAVQILRTTMVDGRREVSMAAVPGQTNDRGEYRVFGLAPGAYVVQARAQQNPFTGGQLTRQVTEAEVRWGEQQIAQAQTVAATAAGSANAPPQGSVVAYSTVYFPGTTFASDAAVVTLLAGEERRGVDFSLSLVPTAQIAGTVLGLDGAPAAGASVLLESVGGAGGDLISLMLGSGRSATGPDGTFTMTGITPGQYSLIVRGVPAKPGARPATPAESAMAEVMAMASAMTGMFGASGANPATLWASEPVAVNGHDIGPLSLQLREGLTVEGTIVADVGGAPSDVAALRISVSRPTSDNPAIAMISRAMNAATGEPTPDGAFVVRGLIPGQYQVTVLGKPMRLNAVIPGMTPAQTGWVVKSIQWRGEDLADIGIDVQAGVPITGVVVTLTNRPAQLNGTVTDSAGRPTGAFPIVVFSADRSRWGAGSRRVMQAQPASNGKFSVVGLPPGDYYVAAVTRLEPGDLTNRQFLEELAQSGMRISIAEGENKTQNLKLAAGG